MYHKDFYITKAVWNNAFSFDERKNKKLFVPALKKITNFDEIGLLEKNEQKITFEEYDFNENMQSCFGLKNLYEINWQWTPLYLVDNHNHVFYFWYLARSQGIIDDSALLYHIDEHADTRDPWEYILKPDSEDLHKVFEYTNFALNVGNYIVPAEKEWLIWETIQIRWENALIEYLRIPLSWILSPAKAKVMQGESHIPLQGRIERGLEWKKSIILNLDLDFFEPELDFIDYNLKKQVILDIAKRADLITVCTSPYFIGQRRALDVFRDIFS